jgi:tetratricopeptide (TPR) repeat protein
MKKDPVLGPHYLAALDELSRSQPDNPIVLAALGRRSLYEKDYEKAAGYLSKALDRGSQATTTYLDLGDALSAAGKHEEAAAAYQRGIDVSPYAPVLYKSLALEYITLKQYDRAHEIIRRHVELFPEDSFMRGLLAKIEANSASR